MKMCKFKNQYLACYCVNLTAVSYGLSMGWCSYNTPILLSENSPLDIGPVSTEQMSWIAAIFCVGGAFSSLTFGFIAEKIGRKNTLLLCGVCHIIGWSLAISPKNVETLYASRICTGIGSGGASILTPVYITEIADKTIRGRLGMCMILATFIGALISYILGAFCGSAIMCLFGLLSGVVFILWMLFIPETPIYLSTKNKMKAAEKSLKFFDHKMSVDELIKTKDSSKGKGISWTEICIPTTRRAIVIGFISLTFVHLSGAFAFVSFASSIFIDAGAVIHPDLCAIVVGILQLLGSITTVLLIDRLGRKILLIASSLGSTVFLLLMGVYCYYNYMGFDVSNFKWIPLISLSGLIYAATFGVRGIPYIVAAEILPQNIRGEMVGMMNVIVWLIGFLLLKYFAFAVELIHLHGCMFVFAVCCTVFVLFVLLFLPETKGRSYDEIKILFAKKEDCITK